MDTEYEILFSRIWENSHHLFGGHRASVPALGIVVDGQSKEECTAGLVEKIAVALERRRPGDDFDGEHHGTC